MWAASKPYFSVVREVVEAPENVEFSGALTFLNVELGQF